MTNVDHSLVHACEKEKWSRLNYFLQNSDIIYKNAKVNKEKYTDQVEKLQYDIILVRDQTIV